MSNLRIILGSSAYWQVNKEIAKHLKCNDSAILLSDLISKSAFFLEKGMTTDDGFFFNTSANIEEDTNIAYRKQKKCIELLVKNGFIETKLTGVPAKLHFKIGENKILRFINSRIAHSSKLELPDGKNSYNKNKDKNKEKEETKEAPEENPFSLDALKGYALEKAQENNWDEKAAIHSAVKAYETYKGNGWRNSKNKQVKNLKTTWLNNWTERLPQAPLKNPYDQAPKSYNELAQWERENAQLIAEYNKQKYDRRV